MIEKKSKNEKRIHATSDKPLPVQIPENCIECASSDTNLIYHDYYKSKPDDYGDDAGWSYQLRTREYKCNKCGIYFVFELIDANREYYTR